MVRFSSEKHNVGTTPPAKQGRLSHTPCALWSKAEIYSLHSENNFNHYTHTRYKKIKGQIDDLALWVINLFIAAETLTQQEYRQVTLLHDFIGN